MRRRTASLVLVALLAVPGAVATGEPRVETVARGLEVPWALAFAPDGRLFVTERPGRIRVMQDGRLDPRPVATLEVAATGEAGLMGLASTRASPRPVTSTSVTPPRAAGA